MSRQAIPRRAIWVGLLAISLLGTALPSAWGRSAARTVTFHGYRVTVPASWPVYDLARHPSTCVRFDRHAVYVGSPSARQRCPAHAVGRTEAILVTPIVAAAARVRPVSGQVAPTAGAAVSFDPPGAGVQVTATWLRHRALVSRILGRRVSASLPASAASAASAGSLAPDAGARGSAVRQAPRHAAAGSAEPYAVAAQASYGGLGFDACSAPSTAAMAAWGTSPYHAVGIYIGGPNRGCSQPNLTASWVSGEVSAGWHPIPIYVGLQGAGSGCGCSEIDSSTASSEGAASAADAVTQAQALGIPAGNPIYDDMEQYARSAANSAAVLAYLSGWTTQLHAAGYVSGVYSSASSGITDLVAAAGTGYTEPDDLWIADWNGEQTTADPYVPAGEWGNHQRIHQYDGGHNETYGGVTLNIDGDYLDGAAADTASPIPDGTFVQVAGTPAVYEVAGGAPLYVSNPALFGSPAPVQISQAQLNALRAYPADGIFLTTTAGANYRVAGGAPIAVSTWNVYGGIPEPSVTVDEWDLANLSNPLSHLRSAPLDGTMVLGLPSGLYWTFAGGLRLPAAPNVGAIPVDQVGLATFPIGRTGGVGSGGSTPLKAIPRCVVPRLKHMSLVRARRALKRSDCRLGTVRRPRRWGRYHLLRVFGQSARAHSKHASRFKVNIRML